jgi:hypothetical protein
MMWHVCLMIIIIIIILQAFKCSKTVQMFSSCFVGDIIFSQGFCWS